MLESITSRLFQRIAHRSSAIPKLAFFVILMVAAIIWLIATVSQLRRFFTPELFPGKTFIRQIQDHKIDKRIMRAHNFWASHTDYQVYDYDL